MTGFAHLLPSSWLADPPKNGQGACGVRKDGPSTSTSTVAIRREFQVKRVLLLRASVLASAMMFAMPWYGLNAHGVTYPDEQEVTMLAANVDKAIQACGVHAVAFGQANGEVLTQRGVNLSEEAPEVIRALASPSTLGASRYHRWLDPHAEIWLIASKEKPACRIGIANSQWVNAIGPKLAELVQVGNYWRPAKEGESPIRQIDGGPIQSSYVMDLPEPSTVRPLLTMTTARSGMSLSGGQQMIITVLLLSKN